MTVPTITQNFGRPSYRPETPAGLDPEVKRLATVAASLAGGLLLVVGLITVSHHGRHRGVPVIQAEAGPVRVKPLDPGGMKVTGAEETSSGVEALAPAAEKPALHALRAKSRAASAHAVAATAEKPSAAPPQAAAPAVPTQGKSAAIQLAAFASQQAAEQDWGKLAEKIPGLFDGHRPEVERGQVAGHTVFRLRTDGFASVAAAGEFCGKVRAKGGSCSVATS